MHFIFYLFCIALDVGPCPCLHRHRHFTHLLHLFYYPHHRLHFLLLHHCLHTHVYCLVLVLSQCPSSFLLYSKSAVALVFINFFIYSYSPLSSFPFIQHFLPSHHLQHCLQFKLHCHYHRHCLYCSRCQLLAQSSILASFSYLHHCLHFAQLHHKLHFLAHGCYPNTHQFLLQSFVLEVSPSSRLHQFLNVPYLHLCPHYTHPRRCRLTHHLRHHLHFTHFLHFLHPHHRLNFLHPHHICHAHCCRPSIYHRFYCIEIQPFLLSS